MNLQPKQFTQQSMWPEMAPTVVAGRGSAIPMEAPESDRREGFRGQREFQIRGNYEDGRGSWTSWQTQWQLGRRGHEQRQRESAATRAQELDSGQRAMFMTPREIHERYEPLSGDRKGVFVAGADDSGSHSGPVIKDEGGAEFLESDRMLWDRKLQESKIPKRDYDMAIEAAGGPSATGTDTYIDRLDPTTNYPDWKTGHTDTFDEKAEAWADEKAQAYHAKRDSSLYDSIIEEGVKSPVRLGESRRLRQLEIDSPLSEKPQIVGGHHRLAAATEIDQDRLIPVLHDKDILGAKFRTKRSYPYT